MQRAHAISMLSLCQQTFHAASGASLLPLFRHGQKKKKENMVRRSLIVPSLTRRMMLGRIGTTLRAVMSDSTPLRCGVGERCRERSEGESSPHHIESRLQQVGDAGATALADSLLATVLACGQQLFRACASWCRFSW